MIGKKDIPIILQYLNMISVLFCFMVYAPIGYTTIVIQTEPAKTLNSLQYNPIMQILFVITFIYTTIIWVGNKNV